jgi:hypothetical protein
MVVAVVGWLVGWDTHRPHRSRRIKSVASDWMDGGKSCRHSPQVCARVRPAVPSEPGDGDDDAPLPLPALPALRTRRPLPLDPVFFMLPWANRPFWRSPVWPARMCARVCGEMRGGDCVQRVGGRM